MKECAIKLNYALRFNFYTNVIDRFIFFPDIKQCVQSRTAPRLVRFQTYTVKNLFTNGIFPGAYCVQILRNILWILCVGWPRRDNCLLWGVSHKMFVLSWRKYLCVHRNIAEIMVGSHRDHQQPGYWWQLRQWPVARGSGVSGVWADHQGWAGQLPSCMIRQKMDHLNKVSLKGPATFLESLSASHSIIILTGH